MMLTLDELKAKWDYKPERRTETIAGFKPISEAQIRYINALWENVPKVGDELIELISQQWGLDDISQWTSADAQFVINQLRDKTQF